MGIDTSLSAAADIDGTDCLHPRTFGRVLVAFVVLLIHVALLRAGVLLTVIVVTTEAYVWWEYRRAYGAALGLRRRAGSV